MVRHNTSKQMPQFRLVSTAFSLIGIFLLQACNADVTPRVAAEQSTRQLANGTVVGFADSHDTWSWLGIPYAQAPTGELRWRAPRPVQPWADTLQALHYANMCPQFPIPMVNNTDQEWIGEEDCLYLNISAPRSWSPQDKALPVMLWLHGGGNTVGSADLYHALPNLAARERVVVVSIQYRLGILGWFSHPALRAQAANAQDASGNFGTLDTIAALQWVRDNIHAFGGDPGNVTVFGESAGGANTFALLLSPLAQGLFHRAISQSGILMTSAVASAENPADATPAGHRNSSSELLARLLQGDGMTDSRRAAFDLMQTWRADDIMSYLRAKPPEALLRHMQGVEMGMYRVPHLLRDGAVLPTGEPLQVLARGDFNRVPVILGTNRDEMKTMMIRHPDYTRQLLGLLPRVKDLELYNAVTGYGSAMWKALGADEPAAAMYAAGHRNIFVYRFDWDEVPSNWLLDFKNLLGAAHSFEIPFVFSAMDNEMAYLPFELIDAGNRDEASALAAAMSSYWGQFARAGVPANGTGGALPEWAPWQREGLYQVFDVPVASAVITRSGRVDRDAVFRELAEDRTHFPDEASRCRAYRNLFAGKAIFAFAAQCPEQHSCPGSPGNFCDPAD